MIESGFGKMDFTPLFIQQGWDIYVSGIYVTEDMWGYANLSAFCNHKAVLIAAVSLC